jgi:regulator of PEP synthase PpsR (kinase-PPPase family)
VQTVLAQFSDIEVPVIRVSHVRQIEQIESIVEKVAAKGGTIVHTLVDSNLRKTLTKLGRQHKVETIDLMGSLLNRLTDVLGQKPVGQPGLYRQLHQVYFDRVEAIEFGMAHDDGQKPQDLPKAEIVLIGVSRLGATGGVSD